MISLSYLRSSVRDALSDHIVSRTDPITYFSIADVFQVESILHNFPMISPISLSEIRFENPKVFLSPYRSAITSIFQESSTRIKSRSMNSHSVRASSTFARIFKPYLMFNGDCVASTMSTILFMLNSLCALLSINHSSN